MVNELQILGLQVWQGVCTIKVVLLDSSSRLEILMNYKVTSLNFAELEQTYVL